MHALWRNERLKYRVGQARPNGKLLSLVYRERSFQTFRDSQVTVLWCKQPNMPPLTALIHRRRHLLRFMSFAEIYLQSTFSDERPMYRDWLSLVIAHQRQDCSELTENVALFVFVVKTRMKPHIVGRQCSSIHPTVAEVSPSWISCKIGQRQCLFPNPVQPLAQTLFIYRLRLW